MGDGVFNIAKGRVVEYINRVDSNDPSGSEIVVILGVGAITDGTLEDLDDVAVIISDGGFTEATFTNYVRKDITDTGVALGAPDDSNNRFEVDLPDQTWTTAGGATNNTLTRLITAYDSTGSAADSALIPLTFHDFAVTTDASNLVAQFNALGFFRAS